MSEPLPVDIVVRGFPALPPTEPARAHPWPQRALLVDVCSTRPRAGALAWGAYRLLGSCREHVEGRFYHSGQVPAAEVEAVRRGLQDAHGLLEREAFLDQVLFRCVYKLPLRAALVAWDLPFSISRLARNVRVIRSKDGCLCYRFTLWTYVDDNGRERNDFYRPRIDITVADAGRTLIQFTRRKEPDPQDLIPEGATRPRRRYVYRGRFLSLATAVYTLTGEELSLVEACHAFEVEQPPAGEPTPANLDVRLDAFAGLYQAVMAEFARWPGAPYLAPDRALSPSGVGKSLLAVARPQTRGRPRPGSAPRR